jgi:tRNA 2-selenouridine synthase
MSVSPVSDFIEQIRDEILLIDVRSEAEYNRGHIPRAVNIPLLNNEQRVIIGTLYKQKGRAEAIQKGFELVGPVFYKMIQEVNQLSKSPQVMIYCWRGGMRSNIFSWLISIAGYNACVLKGGYKSYRNWALKQFTISRKIIVLGGKTGSGKTEMLTLIKLKGGHEICLESLANHKGSAFGSLGQKPQPTQEHFENLLAWKLYYTNPSEELWLENESRNIGSLKIPDPLFDIMRSAPVVEIIVDREIRAERILNEYGRFPVVELQEKTKKLIKRMGGQNVKDALFCLETNDMKGWVNCLLDYYDRTYEHSNGGRDALKSRQVNVNWNRADEVENVIMQANN